MGYWAISLLVVMLFVATRRLRCLFNFFHFHFFERFSAESFVVSGFIVTFVAELERTEKNGRDEGLN